MKLYSAIAGGGSGSNTSSRPVITIMLLSYLSSTLFVSVLGLTAPPPPPPPGGTRSCKCQPSQPCWPSEAKWQAFNASVGGILLDVRPISAPCYEGTPEYDAAKCEEVKSRFESSTWRGDQPGGTMHTNWETFTPPAGHQGGDKETCYLPTTPLEFPQCDQGRVPLYSVPVRSAKDISKAIKFATKHNIRLSIKNTGHDFLGRSVARSSLSVWTHWLRDIEFIEGGWKPKGCHSRNNKYAEKEMVVRIDAGVRLHELYRAVGQKNRTVVAGYANTVGAAGGYIQGGGHSPLGPWKGMSSDNMVEAEVVVADGSIVTANSCQNSDLFWALRGGGGGTFGVVTRVTLRTFENPPLVMYGLNFTSPKIITNPSTDTDEAFWKFVHGYLSLLPKISEMSGSGYHWIINNFPIGPNMYINTFFSLGLFPGSDHNNGTDITSLHSDLVSLGSSLGGMMESSVNVFPQTSYLFDFTLLGDDTGMGGNTILGSRLLPRKLFETSSGVDKIITVFKNITAFDFAGPYSVLTCHNVAGGQVAKNKDIVSSALTPAWRETLNHIVVAQSWEKDTPVSEQQRLQRDLTEKMVGGLRSLDWDDEKGRYTMGSYINEADKEEVGWQESFWGYGKEGKYGRLRKVKERWDPKGIFWCRPCVGSEEWDREGMCRV